MLKGVREFARDTDWTLHILEYDGSPFPVADLMSVWSPIGCIVEGSGIGVTSETVPCRDFGRIPVVYLGCEASLAPPNATRVVHGAASTANTAARELLSLGLSNFAFVGAKDTIWSERRKNAFCAAIKANGCPTATLDFSPWAGEYRIETQRLKEWLLALPKPCGIMAANDQLAETVLFICHSSNIAVPDDIAVVGVDNNESICENTTPSLTSVRPDFAQGGRLAAELLTRKIKGSSRIKPETVFSVAGIVRRGSTRLFRNKDASVSAALERIWSPSGSLLTARDVLSEFTCSRRNAEIRFKRTTGRSILQELMSARLERAKALLSQTSLPIPEIAACCGYKFPAHFRNAFRAATGLNPLAWRKMQSKHPS